VFDRKGFASASVREIVELAGVTKPALYYHFGNKDGVLTAILEEGAREFRAAIARAVGRSGGTRDRLFALFDEVNGLFEKNVPVARVAHAVIQGPAEGVPRFDFSVFDRSWEGALQTILEAGRAAGDVRQSDPEDAVLALTGVLSLCAARHLHPQYQSIGQARLRRVVEAVCDGLLVPGPGVASAAAPGA
jgi:AcrR family transcriptional regulator